MEPAIRLKGVRKSYGALEVLRGLDLEVKSGEHLAVIGSSGSGKSTLLRLLMTLEQPDAGSIEIDGENLWRAPDGKLAGADSAHLRRVRGKLGMVFQHFNLFPHMTVLQNVALAPVKVLGRTPIQAREEAKEILAKVGLESKMDSHPAQLSGGQKQRVAIARALALHPKIMLFDEVTSALDPELAVEVLNVIGDLSRQSDMTLLIVTHQMHFAKEIAGRVVFFDQGRILEDASPEVMFSSPQQERTREFLRAVLRADS
ncbi:MAG: ectoine/hydroxyectoine ABC transporter ATP-binding protein EhuA [bacterium]